MMKKAIILLSGGIDSTTALAVAKSQKFELYALSFHYGQRHVAELSAAERVAHYFSVVKHLTVGIDLHVFGGSALTTALDVPKFRKPEDIAEGIPVTYVPARNVIFLSIALGWAEVLDSYDIFIGVNAIDFSGYPDCRPEFIKAFEKMANLATRAGVEGSKFSIHAPLIHLTKAEIIRKGQQLGVDYSMTHSCYDPTPDGKACGSCDSCYLRRKGFTEAGIPDPTIYADQQKRSW